MNVFCIDTTKKELYTLFIDRVFCLLLICYNEEAEKNAPEK